MSKQGQPDSSLLRQLLYEDRFWAVKGSSHSKSFVPVEVFPLADITIRISHTGLLLHKNTVKGSVHPSMNSVYDIMTKSSVYVYLKLLKNVGIQHILIQEITNATCMAQLPHLKPHYIPYFLQ